MPLENREISLLFAGCKLYRELVRAAVENFKFPLGGISKLDGGSVLKRGRLYSSVRNGDMSSRG